MLHILHIYCSNLLYRRMGTINSFIFIRFYHFKLISGFLLLASIRCKSCWTKVAPNTFSTDNNFEMGNHIHMRLIYQINFHPNGKFVNNFWYRKYIFGFPHRFIFLCMYSLLIQRKKSMPIANGEKKWIMCLARCWYIKIVRRQQKAKSSFFSSLSFNALSVRMFFFYLFIQDYIDTSAESEEKESESVRAQRKKNFVVCLIFTAFAEKELGILIIYGVHISNNGSLPFAHSM